MTVAFIEHQVKPTEACFLARVSQLALPDQFQTGFQNRVHGKESASRHQSVCKITQSHVSYTI